ncbi:pentatricopeptide repeat-containing protein At4g18975, chloroplastic-like isoform X2 [Phragmites australis]|uniref:pentatricopeptide repeat-containing protein At4g18975, chloroplastic-like isoform X2 n=1 Tax=Phragmites australis TaxID=29695 RepID=UPI002D77A7B0|nr:pentatricopeptide repeat-containing protein At4g18975, chloroplastic-like isoform X2 [Phragmites australis]
MGGRALVTSLPEAHPSRIAYGAFPKPRRTALSAAAAAMLRRSLRTLHRLTITRNAPCDPVPLHSFWSSHIELIPGQCNKHTTRDFATNNRVTSGRVHQQKESKPTTLAKLLDLQDSKEVVYNTLDAWVAFEEDFPLASLKKALTALEKEEQWHRIVQVIKWMLSKGQGNTMRTYELLVCALEKDNRAEEAHRIWQKKIAHDLHSVPWRFCHLILAIYYRNNMLDRLVKLFKELEACGRKPPSKDIIRKVEDAYEILGLIGEKKALLDKHKDLYNKPSRNDRKKGSKLKKTDMDKTAADGSTQSKMETSENLPHHDCPSDKESVMTI